MKVNLKACAYYNFKNFLTLIHYTTKYYERYHVMGKSSRIVMYFFSTCI